MKMQWIKHTGLGLAAVAFLLLMAACSPASANNALSSFAVNTSSNTATNVQTNVNTSSPSLIFELSGQSGNIVVNADTTNTLSVFVNGQQIGTQRQVNGVYTVANPSLVANAFVKVNVPAQSELRLKENSGTINVTGVTGQMDLEVGNGNITTSQVTLTGSSLLKAKTGTIAFAGSVDHFSFAHLTTDQGFISVKLPNSSSFHVDAVTKAGNISTNFASSGTAIHADHGAAPRAFITLDENSGSMDISLV
ncbi:MAG: hypothetical protein JOZ71_05200 [Ktedonobacteraceae bacterium]|nr:hypothetical protein [Ktedonobacteraceae bacterium]